MPRYLGIFPANCAAGHDADADGMPKAAYAARMNTKGHSERCPANSSNALRESMTRCLLVQLIFSNGLIIGSVHLHEVFRIHRLLHSCGLCTASPLAGLYADNVCRAWATSVGQANQARTTDLRQACESQDSASAP